MDSPTENNINQQTDVSKKLTSNEVMLRDILIAHLRNFGIDVITDQAAGQRILDDYQNGILNNEIRLQSVFHGSGANFDHFDTRHHLSEGEGNQVFGVGTYVTAVRKVAEQYANIASLTGNKDKFIAVVDGVSFNYNDPKHATDGVFLACDKLAKFGREEAVNALKQNISDYVQLGWSEKEAEAREALNYLNSHDIHVPERGRYLYTVDIPDDNGKNFLYWDGSLTSMQAETIRESLYKAVLERNDDYKASEKFLAQELSVIKEGSHIGDTYGTISDYLGSDKAASEFLSGLGYTGIKVHTDHFGNDPRYKDDWNYVIFNEKDLGIKDKIKFFKAANGDAYGFTVNNKIYVDPKIANSETPIHEYAHMWAAVLRAENKQEWDNVVSLMKNQKELWNSVKARYPQLTTDDEIADEVLATYSGKRGSERLREQVSRLMGESVDAESSNMFKAFEEAIKLFWHDVADLFHIHYDSAEQVADQVMSDMLHGMRPSVTEADGVKSSLTDEEADLDRLYAEAVASGNTEEAHQLLVDRAKSKGYLPTDYQGKDSWSAPVAEVEPNDFENKEALQQMVDDFGTEPNIFGIINGIQAHDSDYYYNPDVAGFHGQAAEETAEVLRSLRDQRANGDTQVDIYRVVPNDVVGDQIMQGDWVALSKAYCDELGQHKYGEGNYHVIESRSAIKNLWMGSEDMREFGFDDGYGDVEKNVRNNRKLLDITYDDEGNLIPLSQRFNEGKEDVKFQLFDDNNLKKDSSQTHMDEEKEKSNEDHLSSYTKDVMKIFADRMVKMMQEMKASDYKQGWAVGSGRNMLPMNITGRTFDGLNILMANYDTYKNDYVSPIYMTGMQIVNHGWRIKEEEKAKALPILAYVPSYLYDGKFINQKKYDELSSEEKDKAKISFIIRVYKEYNLDQTNVADVNPQLYAKLTSFGEDGRVAKDSEGMYVSPELDRMFKQQEWVCPIRYEKPSPEAFYSPSDDRIVVPMKKQYKISKTPEEVFKDGQAYYADVLHEMAHSTGHPSRLDRPFIQKAGDENYAREELVAELSSALVSSALGFDKRIDKNSAAYLDGWVRHLSDNPSYIKNLMSPVKKASMMILESIDKQRIALGMEPLVRHGEVDLVKLVESQSVKQDDTLDKDAIADGYANNMEKQWDEVVKMFGQDENLFDQLTTAASGQPLDSVKHTDKFDIIHDFINQYGGKKELGAETETTTGALYNSHSVAQLNLNDGSVLEVNDYSKAFDDSVKDVQELSHVRDGAIIDSARKEIGRVNQKVNQEALNNLWSAFVGSAPMNRIHEKQIVNDKEKAVGQETLRTENRGKTKVISTGNYYNTETDRSAVFALHWMWSDLLNGRDVNNHLSDYVMSRQNFSHQIKAGNVSQIEPSMLMSHELLGNIGQGNQDKYVLVPIPEHTGKADYTLQLAEHIGVQTGIEVSDMLESKEHAEFYDIKKNRDANSIDPEKVDFGIKVKDGTQLPNGKIPILVDNVLDTGKTISDSAKALNTKEHMALVFANTDKWKEHPSYNIEVAPPAHYRESKDGKSINDIVTQVSRLVTVDDGNVKDSSRQRPRFVQAAVGVNYLNNIRENMGKAWFDDEKNWNMPVSRDNYLTVHAERVKSVADQGKLDMESEVRTLIDKYEDENAPRELFDYSNWSDEKLLAYMKLDGGGEFNHAMNVDVYEEYDARHDKEFHEAYDKAYEMHTLGKTSFTEATRLLGELYGNTDALTTPERTEHLAHQDALVDYISDLNKENYITRSREKGDSLNDKEKTGMSKDGYVPTPSLDGKVKDSQEQVKDWYVLVNFLKNSEDIAVFEELESNDDYKGMLRKARIYDLSADNDWNLRNTFKGRPKHYFFSDETVDDNIMTEDEDYSIVKKVRESSFFPKEISYSVFRKVTEEELLAECHHQDYGDYPIVDYRAQVKAEDYYEEVNLSHDVIDLINSKLDEKRKLEDNKAEQQSDIDRFGLSQNANDDVLEVAKRYDAEKATQKVESEKPVQQQQAKENAVAQQKKESKEEDSKILFDGTREEAWSIVDAIQPYIDDPDITVLLDEWLKATDGYGTPFNTDKEWYKKYAKGKTDHQLVNLYHNAKDFLELVPKEDDKKAVDPIMSVYGQMKEEHPNTILLFKSKSGKFYNSYMEDASTVSEILRLPLQKSDEVKDKDGKFVDNCTFPSHALDTYLPMLVRAGERSVLLDYPPFVEDRIKASKLSEVKQETPHEDSDMRTDVTDTAKHIVASDNVPMEQAEKEAKEIADEQVHKDYHQQQDKLHAEEEKRKQQEQQEQEKKHKVLNSKLYDVFGMKDGKRDIIKSGLTIIAAANFVERNDERYQRKGYDYLISMPHVEEKLEKVKSETADIAKVQDLQQQQATVRTNSDETEENNQEQEDMNNKEEQLKQQAKKEEELHKEESSMSEPVTPKASSDDSAKEKAEQTNAPSSKEDEKVVNTAAVHAGLLLGALESAKEGIWLNPHGKHGAALLEPGKMITGYNRLMMDLFADKNHYKTNVFTYYDYAKKEEMPVKQGQTSLPIDWTRWDYENVATKEVITKEQYAELTPEKQQDYARHSTKQTRHLYNIDQTAMAGTKVADYSKLVKDNGFKFEDIPELPTDKNFLNLTNRLHGKHKDCTIILGEGDKNFAYGAHAEKVGSVMGAPVQSKVIDGKKVSYIEFPHNALDTVLPKMIGSHNKVALCSNVLESKFEASNNISKNSVRDAATVADKVSRKAGFTLERVLDDVPVSYDKEKDVITYSGNNARQPGRENLAAVEKANDIYRAVVEATGRENRLDREARFNMLPEDNAKYEKLVQELSSGVLMAAHGLPAIISKENRELIPYWEREIKENPKMMAVLEKDVNNSIEQIEKHLLGQEVDYAKIRGARPALFDAKDYTVASKMAQLPNAETKEFVIIRNAEKTAADVILPEGATLPEGASLPGMSKERIAHALAKENINEVHFYNAGGAQGLYKDNDYFAGKTATLTKLKQWELLPRHVVDISSQYLNVEKKPLIERFRAIPDDSHRWAFNIKAKGEGQFSVYPAKEYLNAYFTARDNPNKVEKAKMMSTLAQRYYAVAQAHPEVKKELIMPKVPEDVDMSKLKGTTIGRDKDDHSKVFVQSTIDGAFHKEPITMAQYQRMWLADDMQDYKKAIAANAFASIIKSAKAQQEADEGLKIVDNSNVKDVVGHSEKQDQGHSESHSEGGTSGSGKSESEDQSLEDTPSKQADKSKPEEENKSRGFHM